MLTPQPSAKTTFKDQDIESRKVRRNRVLKGGTIIGENGNSEVTCTLRKQHEGGAQIIIEASAVIPKEFVLYVPIDCTGYKAVLRWRKGDRAGVQLLGMVPKPAHHYG